LSGPGLEKSSQAFRTIAEAAAELNVATHMLRFWEGKFTHIKPLKRAGGRRHYRPDDMALLRGIRALLHEDGYQIKGVQKLLRDQGVAWVRGRGEGGNGQASAQSHSIEPSIVISQPMPAEDFSQLGPLFEAVQPTQANLVMSPATETKLRQALTKLETARDLLNQIATNPISNRAKSKSIQK
jgi:DNA-binding transcriptional MerR regulator